METAELDVALEELESRLERLRALYEQYFMGFEKIEPAIARKDVDRRIYVLRREKIRNTAKRFKLQTIIQRYNTFQQYWQRICREIENGTYKRHLLRAQKQGDLLTITARKRLGRQAAPLPETPAASEPPSAPPPATPAPAANAPADQVPPTAVPRPLGAPPLPRRPPLPSRKDAVPPAPAVAAAPAPPVTKLDPPPAPALSAPHPVSKLVAAKFENLDLDMDFMGDWDPGTRAAAPAAKPPVKPAPPLAKPATLAARPSPALPVMGSPPARAEPLPVGGRPVSIAPAPVVAPPRPVSARPPTAPLGPRAPAPPRPPVLRPPPAAPRPAPPVIRAPSPAAAPPAASPPAAAVPPPPKPAPAAAPKPAAAAAPVAGHVDDARLRDLHSKLVQAKRQTNEANVSYEGLAKSIRATEAKLREQHKDRKIDFDVVIKDGRAVVKPIVR